MDVNELLELIKKFYSSPFLSPLFGLIGAYLGYIGSSKGAKKGIELTCLLKKQESLKLLNAQIKYSIKNIESLKNISKKQTFINEAIYFPFESIIYNNKWNEQMSQLKDIDEKELEDIILWFMSIKSTGDLYKRKGYLFKGEVDVLLTSEALDINKMTKITQKIDGFLKKM